MDNSKQSKSIAVFSRGGAFAGGAFRLVLFFRAAETRLITQIRRKSQMRMRRRRLKISNHKQRHRADSSQTDNGNCR